MPELHEYLKYLAGLIAIVNPIGIVPVFIGLTQGQTAAERRRIAGAAAVSVGVVLLVSLFVGEGVLSFFGIGIPSFRVGGGLLILLMSISMLQARMGPARHTPEELEAAADKESIAVVPLAIPLLSGPGAISTVILYAHRSENLAHYLLLVTEILLVAALVWLVLRAAPAVSDWLGRTGINVVTRIMGLIMASIGVEFIANGLRQLLPGLG